MKGSEAATAVLTAAIIFAVMLMPRAIAPSDIELQICNRAVVPDGAAYFYEEEVEQPPRWIFPIHVDDYAPEKDEGALSSPYGERDPQQIGGYGDDFHDGIDVWGVSHVGTWHARIVASADGVVKDVYPAPDGYWSGHPVMGGYIHLLHDDGSETKYGHLSKTFVWRIGERVEQGQLIGRQGNTGRSFREHLHFELIIDGENVNPLKYIDVPN